MGQGAAGDTIDFAINVLVANVLKGFPVQISAKLPTIYVVLPRRSAWAIHAKEQQGIGCLQAQSTQPKTVQPIFDEVKREQLRFVVTLPSP